MIGWYVHHHGSGHLHRAVTVARHLDQPVTGLSSLPRPDGWPGEWIQLPLDVDRDVDPTGDTAPVRDAEAGGTLHWAPLGHPGLRARSAAVSAWVHATSPSVVVVDVSVEVAVLVRLHGVPVVTVALPGERGDPAHQLGYDLSSAIIAAWPASATSMLPGVDEPTSARLTAVGAISRYAVGDDAGAPVPRSVVALFGSGGDDLPAGWLHDARARTPEWTWTVLGGRDGEWIADPWSTIRSASVVVTHAGQNAVAEVAAARRPAIVVPQERPFAEQATTARVLRTTSLPVEVIGTADDTDWPSLLQRVASLDGERWASWCDGHGAERAAHVIEDVALCAAASEGP